jgi:hypothetical protein
MFPLNKKTAALINYLSNLLFCVLTNMPLLQAPWSEMRYAVINKETSLLYFRLDVFYQFEARVPKFDTVLSVVCTLQGERGGVACQILGLWPQIGRLQLAQSTMTTSLC